MKDSRNRVSPRWLHLLQCVRRFMQAGSVSGQDGDARSEAWISYCVANQLAVIHTIISSLSYRSRQQVTAPNKHRACFTSQLRCYAANFVSAGALLLAIFPVNSLMAHDGPDPVFRWRFSADDVRTDEDLVRARLGPDGKIVGNYQLLNEEPNALFLEGGECGVIIAEDRTLLEQPLPKNTITAAAWVSIDKRQTWGGIVGSFQDNGSSESGWVLGYNEKSFSFGITGENGPGKMTYLSGKTEYETGKLYHVVGVYDGSKMGLYVNGKLEAESPMQSGPILYAKTAPFVLGAYRDDDEFFGHYGRLIEIKVFDIAAKAAWAEHDYSHNAAYADRPAAPIYGPLKYSVDPYLQFGTQTGMTIMWQTNQPTTATLHYGETSECDQSIEISESAVLHEIRLESLRPETQYFYRVESATARTANGPEPGTPAESVQSHTGTFQTAVLPETPFAFAVISDTQGNPKVSGQLAQFAWGQRPSFLLHPGDLVSTGPNDSHWTDHFFPGMKPLIQHVPFFPVLGNHEQNAKNYFDYVSLPAPEYFYTFKYGNTQFFMIDSNRNVGPGSEQYQWLSEQLSSSIATWKIVCHHHPPYSSDENDYGNLWQTNQSTRGDERVRELVPLYEKYQVDIVWNGHIHSYERTWPVRQGKAAQAGEAPIYMITGGGGGSLETPGPVRPFFENTVRHGHHYSMVRVNGATIEIQAYDIENRLFDFVEIKK